MILTSFTDVDKQESYAGTEPVSLADAKAQLRVDFTDDDSIISRMITAARQAIENFCHISIVQKTITLTLEATESARSLFAQPYQAREPFNSFELPYGPIKSVDIVTSIDSDGVSVISLALGKDYYLFGKSFRTIKIANSFSNNILVYTVGLIIVPEDLKLAILNEVAYRYEARGDSQNIRATAFTQQGVCEAARVLASPYKRFTSI